MKRDRAFSLLELLVIIAVIGLLITVLMPALARVRMTVSTAVCATNVKQMAMAMQLYTNDNDNFIFPLKTTEMAPSGTWWWFGFEAAGGPTVEGNRILDRERGRLWQYYEVSDSIELCPSFAVDSPRYKPKYTTHWSTYGLPQKLTNPAVPTSIDQIAQPAAMLAFADCAQINTWQLPASAGNPMFEQWFYVDRTLQTVHYVHDRHANASMFDGHVRILKPDLKLNETFSEAPVGRPPTDVMIQIR